MTGARAMLAMLAVLGPSAVLGAMAWSLVAPEPWSPSPWVRAVDQQLHARPVGGLIVGPSFARTDLDASLLKRQLGLDERVLSLPQDGASAPIWYALLKYRVFDAGLRPRFVVIVPTMKLMMTVRPAATHMANLTEHFAEPDEVIARLTYASERPAWVERALTRRGRLRSAVVDFYRTEPVHLLLGGDGAGLAKAGDEVFGEQHAGARFQMIGGRMEEAAADVLDPGAALAADPAQSYLPELARIAKEAGTHLVLVFPPTAARVSDGQFADDATEARFRELCTELGVGVLDLRRMDYPEEAFTDGRHMRSPTARDFTAEVARRLVEVGALGAGPLQAPSAELQAREVRRSGAAPVDLAVVSPAGGPCKEQVELLDPAPLTEDALARLTDHEHSPLEVLEGGVLLPQVRAEARLGAGCTGRVWHHDGRIEVRRADKDGAPIEVRLSPGLPVDNGADGKAWWTWPGTTLHWTYDAPPASAAGELVVTADVLAVPAEGDPPLLRVGSTSAELRLVDGHWTGELHAPRPGGEWSLDLESPPGAAYGVIQSLRWAVGDVSGVAVRPAPARWTDLLGSATITGPKVPAAVAAEATVEGKRSWVPAPWPNRSGCSPLRVLDGEAPLHRTARDRFEDKVAPGDGLMHLADRLWFPTPADGGAHRYSVGLEPVRFCYLPVCATCAQRAWVYPGEVVRFSLPVATRADLDLRMRALRVNAMTLDASPVTVPVQLVLRVGEEVRARVQLAVEGVDQAGVFPVTPPLFPGEPGVVSLEVKNDAQNPPVVLRAWGGGG